MAVPTPSATRNKIHAVIKTKAEGSNVTNLDVNDRVTEMNLVATERGGSL